ncbi:hypothetical protein OIU78_004018 [Salix suchowensis]|nr:hypothetical protein OIU78_004018 [Salix suchowensis]
MQSITFAAGIGLSLGNIGNDLRSWWPPLCPAEVLIYGRKALQPNPSKTVCLTIHVNWQLVSQYRRQVAVNRFSCFG